MIKIIKPFFNKYYFLISYLLILLVNFQILGNQGFSDDFTFLRIGAHIESAPNPFFYFFPWSIYFKSWSFTYMILWFMFKAFGTEFLYYRILNLSIHFLNHVILRKILKRSLKLSETRLNLYSLIFLLHPLSILTTSWVFQLKTLLGVLFMLLFIDNILRQKFSSKKDILKNTFLFWLSLTSKISAVLLPIPLFFLVRKKLSLKKTTLVLMPLFFISLVYGLFNIKGITAVHSEVDHMSAGISEVRKKRKFTKTDFVKDRAKYNDGIKTGVNYDINIFEEVTSGANSYITPIFEVDNFIVKYMVSVQNLGRFILSSIGLNNYLPFYEDNISTAVSPFTYFYFLIGIGAIIFLFLESNLYLRLSLFLFFPISGMFYIPYMKFSYTSDHWFYAAFSIFFIYIIHKIYTKPQLSRILGLVIFASYFLTIYKYRSFPELLRTNYAFYKNPIIPKNITNYYQLNGETQKLVGVYTELVEKYDHDDHFNQNRLIRIAYDLQDFHTLKRFYPQTIVNLLDRKNLSGLEVSNRYFKEYITEKDFNLAPSLNSINSHNIAEDHYQAVIKYLK